MGRSGSGLGLAVVWGVIKDLGGFIDVATELGAGTTFKVYLPATNDVGVRGETASQLEGNETILVVDDERHQRELAVELLSTLGYRVTACSSGRAALRFLEVNPPPDLLVLDMVMEADFDGLLTLQHVRARLPELPCIIASGFAKDERFKQATALGASYVGKPYTRDAIGKAVRRALDRQTIRGQAASHAPAVP
jgi:CheY-like chemotaxis protein